MKIWKEIGTDAFFLPPFFPLEIRLFLPTAMVSLFAEIRVSASDGSEYSNNGTVLGFWCRVLSYQCYVGLGLGFSSFWTFL